MQEGKNAIRLKSRDICRLAGKKEREKKKPSNSLHILGDVVYTTVTLYTQRWSVIITTHEQQ
jgi:hypothetical protein